MVHGGLKLALSENGKAPVRKEAVVYGARPSLRHPLTFPGTIPLRLWLKEE